MALELYWWVLTTNMQAQIQIIRYVFYNQVKIQINLNLFSKI